MTLDQRKIKINAGFKTDHNYKTNRQYYFNPSEAVGLGSTAGVGIGTTIFFTGITSTNLGISSIYIPSQALYHKTIITRLFWIVWAIKILQRRSLMLY